MKFVNLTFWCENLIDVLIVLDTFLFQYLFLQIEAKQLLHQHHCKLSSSKLNKLKELLQTYSDVK